jgi:hypothetical protein
MPAFHHLAHQNTWQNLSFFFENLISLRASVDVNALGDLLSLFRNYQETILP